jgi:hypothetical protein
VRLLAVARPDGDWVDEIEHSMKQAFAIPALTAVVFPGTGARAAFAFAAAAIGIPSRSPAAYGAHEQQGRT